MSESTNHENLRKRFILIPLAVAVAVALGWVYYKDISLIKLVMNTHENRGIQIGRVKSVTGKLRLQPVNSLEYILAQEGDDLFEDDTVMTGPEDRAVLELTHNKDFEIKPGSLVRLTFETKKKDEILEQKTPELILRDSAQTTRTVTVIVTPTPQPVSTPAPLLEAPGLAIILPKDHSSFSLAPGRPPPPQIHVLFSVPSHPDAKVEISFKNKAGQVIAQGPIPAKQGKGECLVVAPEPGAYRLELLSINGVRLKDVRSVQINVLPWK